MMASTLEANPELQITYVYHTTQSKCLPKPGGCERAQETSPESKVEKDLSTYPPDVVARIKWIPTGTDLALIPANFRKIMSEAGTALREMIPDLKPPPTKFILDQAEAVDYIEQIRTCWPNAKVLMHFTPSAMCYYTQCGGSLLRIPGM